MKDEQNIKVEYVHDYSNIDANSDDNQNEENNQNEEKREVVIPIYTNVKVRSPEESQESHSASNTRPVVNSPGPQYTEHFGVFRVNVKTVLNKFLAHFKFFSFPYE